MHITQHIRTSVVQGSGLVYMHYLCEKCSNFVDRFVEFCGVYRRCVSIMTNVICYQVMFCVWVHTIIKY